MRSFTAPRIITALVVLGVTAHMNLSVFVVHPIGAVPEGRTLIISRMENIKFIDSADAVCERMQGGVNLLCRGAVLAAIAEKSKIYARLPYSEILYGISTGGKRYDH